MKSKKTLTKLLAALIALIGISVFADGGKPEPVIYIQDGAVDEMMVPMLLKTMDNVNLLGVVVVDGDDWAFPTAEVQWKLNALIGLDIPVGISKAEGVNQFPQGYRNDCLAVNALPILNPQGTQSRWTVYDGEQLVADILAKSSEPVTILLNCGATTLVTVLQQHPELQSQIKRMIWMGGAIDPKGGNVVYPISGNNQTLYYCEWNMYWDPTGGSKSPAKAVIPYIVTNSTSAPKDSITSTPGTGAGWLFENASFPIVLFPLDITDSFPLYFDVGTWNVNSNAAAFKKQLSDQSAQGYLYSQIAYACYDIEWQETWNNFYCLWDTVSATYLAHPEYFYVQGYDIAVAQNLTDTPQWLDNPYPQGHLYATPNPDSKVKVALRMADGVDSSRVYDYISAQFKR